MPIIIVGGSVSGIFTAKECAVIAVDYALVVGFFVHKELRVKDLPSLLAKAAITSALVMFIIANASVLGWVLAFQSIPVDRYRGLSVSFFESDRPHPDHQPSPDHRGVFH